VQPLFHMDSANAMNALFRRCSGIFARAFAALMLVALSSCGGSGSPTVALSNMVPVRLAMHLPGQALAQADLVDKMLNMVIPDANAIVLLGVTSVTVTISGNGFTTIVDSFPAGAPGTRLVKQYSVPQGTSRTFSIQGFNTPVGTPATAPVISGSTTVPTLVAGVTPVLVDVVLNPATDRIVPVVASPAPITVPAVNATGTPKTNAAITAFLAGASATDNVDVNPVVTNNAPLKFPLGPTTVTFTSTDAAGNVSTPVQVVVTVNDQMAPVITAPAPITVAAVDATGTPATNAAITAFLAAATAIDNVDANPVVTNDAPLQFPLGPTTVTFTSTDAAGNTSTPVPVVVTVADQSPPSIALSGTNPLAVPQGSVFTDPGSVVTDNVSTGLIAAVTGAVNTTVVGPYTLTYNVSDAAGNPATPVFRTVNVVAPQINSLTGTPAGLVPSAAVINANSGSVAFTLFVNGQFFSNASIVVIDQAGVNVPLTGVTQTFVSAQQLSLSFPVGFFPAGNLQPLNVHIRSNANQSGVSNTVVLSRILQDTTPPGIINSLPQNLATNVDVAASIQVFFTERVDQATVTNISFSLKQGVTPVAGTISFIQTPSNQTIAIFTPNTPLALNTNYVLTLSTAIKDISGNAMLNPATISFTTVLTPTGNPQALNNLGFELGNLSGYSASGQSQILSTLTPVLPTEGTNMVQIDTAGTAVAGKSSTLTSGTMTVPAGMNALIVDLDFLSNEFPQFIGGTFDDVALATLNSVSGTQSFNVTSVNVAPFVTSPTIFGGATGFFPWVFDLTGLQGSNISVQFDVSDVGDTAVTTALLIDNLRFVSQAIVVQPQLKKLAVGATLQFVTQLIGVTGSVTWAVNGIAGGNTTVGVIDPLGLYTAPSVLPANPSVSITATSASAPTISGGSIVNLF